MLIGMMMMSPVFTYLGMRGVFGIVASMAVLFVVFKGGDILLNDWFAGIALVVILLSFVPAIYWTDARYVLSPVFLIFSLFLIQLADQRALDAFVTFSTTLMLVLVAGGIIGFILAFNGVQPLFDIANNDGRPNHFFYTTFSNSIFRVIRPSGIFDEPGTLSFMVCGVAAIRHLSGRDSRVTWLMLGMGFITLSLAHLVYVFFHFLAEKFRFRNVVGIMATLLPLVVLVGYFAGYEVLDKRLLGRVAIAESGEVVGDNRSGRMRNAFDHLISHPRSILVGAHPSCRFDYLTCKEKFPLMGENPLSPLVFQGIFLSWTYYIALGILFVAPLFGREYFVSLGFWALLLQRPYLLDMGYALIGCLVVVMTIRSIVARRFGSRSTRVRCEDAASSTQIHLSQ